MHWSHLEVFKLRFWDVTPRVADSLIWSAFQKFAFLTNSHMMLMLLVWGWHFYNHCFKHYICNGRLNFNFIFEICFMTYLSGRYFWIYINGKLDPISMCVHVCVCVLTSSHQQAILRTIAGCSTIKPKHYLRRDSSRFQRLRVRFYDMRLTPTPNSDSSVATTNDKPPVLGRVQP